MNYWSILLLILAKGHALKGGLREPNVRQLNNHGCFTCHLAKLELLLENEQSGAVSSEPETASYSCIRSEQGRRRAYDIPLADDFIHAHGHEIEEGIAQICIPGGYISEDGSSVVIPQGRRLRLLDHDSSGGENRRLRQDVRRGTKKLLAIRVVSVIGEEPTERLSNITSAIFGVDPIDAELSTEADQDATVVDQFREVSGSALSFVAASGPRINYGVAQVVVNHAVVGEGVQGSLNEAILAATENQLGAPLDELADHIVFCLPDGGLMQGTSSWTAFTYLFEPYSYYQKSRCTRLSVVMHEIGHSMGFRHSGVGDNKYNDESGYMGYARNRVGWPRKAFNGHKHWISGWFADKSVDAYPLQSAVGGRLVAFVDHGNADLGADDVVLLRVGDLYVQYNRAKSYNRETNSFPDQVTITESKGDGELSHSHGGLSTGESYRHQHFGGSGHALIIQVCGIVESSFDYAQLSIHLDDGTQTSTCDDLNSFGRDSINVQSIVEATSLPVSSLQKKPRLTERSGSKLAKKAR